MRRFRIQLSSFLLFALLSLLLVPTQAGVIHGKVVRVLDGDTIEVMDVDKTTHRVRLAGIDAPEKSQPFSAAATRALSERIKGQVVRVDWHKRDRYERFVGKVLLTGADMSLALVESGLAWWYRDFASEQSLRDRRLYESAERRAREARAGLWADPDPIAPWDWRAGKRANTVKQDGECPCDSGRQCTGSRGGIYCVRPSGSKKYFRRT